MFTEFTSIIDLISKFPTEQHCIDHLTAIRWNGQIVSPFDPTSKVYVCKGNKYKCKTTGKYFNVRTATIFEDTKMPLQKWFLALYIFSSHKKGISSHQLAKDLDITQKSAWFVLHRLRYAFDHPAFKSQLSNTVESDETWIGGKEANKHNSKKLKSNWKKGKSVVVGFVERGGNVIAQQIDRAHPGVVEYLVEKNVKKGSELMTDDSHAYVTVGGKYIHSRVNHTAKQYVDGKAHTNTMEGFWSLFKRGLHGIYHQISFKHLQKYAHEYSLRYNSRNFGESQRFNMILTNMVGRLKYKELTA